MRCMPLGREETFMGFSGYATPEGTARYAARLQGTVAEDHFREFQGLKISSIGLGTYLGEHDAATDAQYREAIIRAVELGCNLIDTAVNYRFQQSERAIGQALATLFEQGRLQRDELVVATKGGFIPFDGSPPRSQQEFMGYVEKTFVQPGIIQPADIVAGCHCMTPPYLRHQLGTSLHNLGLECVDIYFVHNPETQLEEIPRVEFVQRMRTAFQALESNVAAGQLRWYGTATWEGYRRPPDAADYLALGELVAAAHDVGSEGHHFRVIQLPHNLAMPEALTQQNQQVDGQTLSPLEAAQEFGIYVLCSASILQSRLTRGLPDVLAQVFRLDTDAQRAIQFVRSSPGVGSALVGMKQVSHVEENLAVAKVPPASLEQFMRLFERSS
jgi:aryl-alcohol dehydrogenase-like predicted oxidoreductase